MDCGIASAVLPAGEVANHARRVAERFNQLPPGAVQGAKRLMREPQREAIRAVIRNEGALFRRTPAQPRGDGGLPGLLPEAQARLLEVLTMSLALKLALSPLLVAQGVLTRLRMPRLPEAEGARQGSSGRGAARAAAGGR